MSNYQKLNQDLEETLLNKRQCARMLKISVATLDNWRAKGLIKSYKLGQRVLFKKDEILAELVEE